ncbi:MAG: GGDEF domain-containing protein [Actinomycetota bacterium]
MSDRTPLAFRREGLLGRTTPFVVASALGALIALDPYRQPPRQTALAAAGAIVASLVLVYVIPWHRLPRRLELVPPFSYLGLVLALKLFVGYPSTLTVPLVLIPLFWLALHSARGELTVGFLASAGILVSSIAAGGFGHDEVRFAVMSFVISAIICFTTQNLVVTVRGQSKSLETLAHTDVLTGIANRREWDLQLPREIGRAERQKSELCVALIDLDYFKLFNDEFGHQAGDEFLKETVEAWRKELRVSDLLVRYGGEEFGAILPGCTLRHAAAIIDRLRDVTPRGQTASAGVVAWNGIESLDEMVARADSALYRAKDMGRNRTIAPRSETRRPDVTLLTG